MFFVRVPTTDAEAFAAEWADLEIAGATEEDEAVVLWFDSAAEADAAARRWPHAVTGFEAPRNWNAAWQSSWQPSLVGESWYLVPPGDVSAAPPGRMRLEMHPGTRFGNGDHATTRLCLSWLEQLVRPGTRFLDLGCGSGLLALAASALGAEAFGCDVDAGATEEARQRGVRAWRGSVNAARSGTFDVVVANIQAAILAELRTEFARVVRPGGYLVLSGYWPDQREWARPGETWALLGESEADGWAASAWRRHEGGNGLSHRSAILLGRRS
jgi:ribosomal protein L11 methyltransferase